MKRGLRAVLLLALLWPTIAPQAAGLTVEKRYRLPGHGYLQLNVPASWEDELSQPPDELPPTITFRSRKGNEFAVLVTPIWPARDDVPASTRDSIRRSVEEVAAGVKDHAVEKTIQLVEFSGASGPGFYFSVTDPAPKPDEYRFMTQGMVKVGGLLVTFTILTNDGNAQIKPDALAAIRGATHIGARRAKQAKPALRDDSVDAPSAPEGTRI